LHAKNRLITRLTPIFANLKSFVFPAAMSLVTLNVSAVSVFVFEMRSSMEMIVIVEMVVAMAVTKAKTESGPPE